MTLVFTQIIQTAPTPCPCPQALYAVQRRREALGRTAPLRLAGLSGLGVTPHGINLTISVYGSRERSYICPEHTLWAPMREQEGQRGQEVGGGNVAGGAGGGGGGGGAGGGGGGGGGQGQVQQTYVGHTRRTYRGPGGKWERKLEVRGRTCCAVGHNQHVSVWLSVGLALVPSGYRLIAPRPRSQQHFRALVVQFRSRYRAQAGTTSSGCTKEVPCTFVGIIYLHYLCRTQVHTIHTQEQLQRLLEAGYELLVRCRWGRERG